MRIRAQIVGLWYNYSPKSGLEAALEIHFQNHHFRKQCSQEKKLKKKHGHIRARKILQRLDILRAASTLADMRFFSGRCHELTGDYAEQLALDLDHPYRLIFKPHHDPIPRKADGGLDWTAVTAICIIGVEDYHG